MSWFHATKHERLKRRRQLRMEAAERAIKEAKENWYMVRGIIEPYLAEALEEAQLFEDYFGEPMPAHVHHALQVEIELWQRLLLAIKNAKDLNEKQYATYGRHIHEYLIAMVDLLQAEQEMISSCLVQYYEHIVTTTRDAARKAL